MIFGSLTSGLALGVVGAGGGGAVRNYLASVTSAPLAIYGMAQMVGTYSGPLYTLRRSADNATMDVSPKAGTQFPDYTVISTWAGASSLVLTKQYDQSGAGRDRVPSAGREPTFFLQLAFAGCVPCNFVQSTMTSTVPMNRQNVTTVHAIQNPRGIDPGTGFWTMENAGVFSLAIYFPNLPSDAMRINNGSDFGQSSPLGVRTRANPSVIAFTSDGSGFRFFARETNVLTATLLGSQAIDTFKEGLFTTQNWDGQYLSWGTVLYPALSVADTNTVIASLATIFSIPTTFTSRAIMAAGDSIAASSTGVGKTLAGTVYNIVKARPDIEFFNLAQGSSLQSQHYSARASYGSLYTAAYGAGKCTFMIQSGTNDLDINQAVPGATLYANTTTPLIAYYNGLGSGARVEISDILPRSDGNWNSTRETQRLAYNSAVLGNAAGAAATVDLANTSSTMGAAGASDNTTLYADKLHPTALGDTYIAPQYVAGLV